MNLDLELFASTASRTNLRYSVIHADSDNDKYLKLRELVAESNCPTIIYVSRTKRTEELATKLTRDGYKALPFNGKMESDEKIANQDAFMNDQVHIIVATSAFGMGVDKKMSVLWYIMTFPIRWRTTFKKQVEPVVIPASARVVMCFIVTMIWTSILYY